MPERIARAGDHPGRGAVHRRAVSEIRRRAVAAPGGAWVRRLAGRNRPGDVRRGVVWDRSAGAGFGRGNIICPDTSSRSHSLAVKSQESGHAYHRDFVPGHQAEFSGDPWAVRVPGQGTNRQNRFHDQGSPEQAKYCELANSCKARAIVSRLSIEPPILITQILSIMSDCQGTILRGLA